MKFCLLISTCSGINKTVFPKLHFSPEWPDFGLDNPETLVLESGVGQQEVEFGDITGEYAQVIGQFEGDNVMIDIYDSDVPLGPVKNEPRNLQR